MSDKIEEVEASFRTWLYGIGTVCVIVTAAVLLNGYRALSHYHVYWGASIFWTLLLAPSLGVAVAATTYIVQWEHNRRWERDKRNPDYSSYLRRETRQPHGRR